MKIKELEVEMEQLRQLIVTFVGCASSYGGGTVDDKVGEGDEKNARESSSQLGRRLREGKVTGQKETGRKETGRNETGHKEMGRKTMRMKETRWKETGEEETGGKAPGAQYSQERGGKGDVLVGEREMDNMLPGDPTAGQNATKDPTQELL